MDFKGDVEHRLCQICGPTLSFSVVYEMEEDLQSPPARHLQLIPR